MASDDGRIGGKGLMMKKILIILCLIPLIIGITGLVLRDSQLVHLGIMLYLPAGILSLVQGLYERKKKKSAQDDDSNEPPSRPEQ